VPAAFFNQQSIGHASTHVQLSFLVPTALLLRVRGCGTIYRVSHEQFKWQLKT